YLGDRSRLAALGGDGPALRFAVKGRPLLALALAVGEDVDRAGGVVPLRRAVAGEVEGEPAGGLPLGVREPQVGLAVVGGLLPAAFRVGDALAVRRDGEAEDVRLGEVVVEGGVGVGVRLRGGGGGGDGEAAAGSHGASPGRGVREPPGLLWPRRAERQLSPVPATGPPRGRVDWRAGPLPEGAMSRWVYLLGVGLALVGLALVLTD